MSIESIVSDSENEPFAGNGAFPLAGFLRLEVPMREVVLPLLTPEDLSALELVSRDVRDVIRGMGYWETALKRFVESDCINRQIYDKCIVGLDDQAVADGDDVDGTADSRDYRKIFYQIQEYKRRLEANIRRGHRKEYTVPWQSGADHMDLDCLSTDVDDFVFIAYEYRVEVFRVAVKREGSTFERASRYDIDFTGKFEEYAGLEIDPSYIHRIRCHGDLLFICHQSGAVSVWTWRDGSLVHNVTRHAFPKEILQKLDSGPLAEWVFCNTTLTAMECKQNRLMIAANRPVHTHNPEIFVLAQEPVTVWRFDETKPFSIALDYQLDFRQIGKVLAIDIDDHLAAIAFGSLDRRIPIALWDLETKTFVRWIYPPGLSVCKLSIHASSNRLMIRPGVRHVLQMFSLHDGEELLSYDMDYVRALGGRKVAATAIARDWKSDQMVVGFTNGAVALYDMNNPQPINVFRRTIENFPITGVIDDFYFLGTRAYLLFVQELKLPVYQFGLFDFLELSP